MSAGRTHTAAVTEEGELYIWGYGETGALGLGKGKISLDQPTRVVAELQDKHVVAVSTGTKHTMAITEDGELYTWGLLWHDG